MPRALVNTTTKPLFSTSQDEDILWTYITLLNQRAITLANAPYSFLMTNADCPLAAAITTVFQIHTTQGKGDILVFLTGQEEIEAAEQNISDIARKLGSRIPEIIIAPSKCYF